MLSSKNSSTRLKNLFLVQLSIIIVLVILSTQVLQLLFSLIINSGQILDLLPVKADYSLVSTIFDILVIILTSFLLIRKLIIKNTFDKKQINFTCSPSIKYLIVFFFVILGLIAYFLHLLIYSMNILLNENYLIAYFADLDLDNPTTENLILMGLKYVFFTTLLEEILFRRFFQFSLMKHGLGLVPSVFLTSFIFTLPFIALIFIINNISYLFALIVVKFTISTVISIVYYLTGRLSYTYLLNAAITSYLLLRQFSFLNQENIDISKFFITVKFSIIYFSIFFVIVSIILHFYNKRIPISFPDSIRKSFFIYSTPLISRQGLMYIFGFFLIIPIFLAYYLDNIFYSNTISDRVGILVIKIVIYLVLIGFFVIKLDYISLFSIKDDEQQKDLKTSVVSYFTNKKSTIISSKTSIFRVS